MHRPRPVFSLSTNFLSGLPLFFKKRRLRKTERGEEKKREEKRREGWQRAVGVES